MAYDVSREQTFWLYVLSKNMLDDFLVFYSLIIYILAFSLSCLKAYTQNILVNVQSYGPVIIRPIAKLF